MKRNLLFVVLMLVLVMAQTVAAADVKIGADAWKPVVGVWSVNGSAYKNTDTSQANTIASAPVAQSGSEITVQWTVTFGATDFSMGPAAGMHLMASESDSATRGLSYLVFQDQSFVRVYRAEGKLVTAVSLETPAVQVGQTFTYKVVVNPKSGLLTVYRDGKELGSWTDAAPIQSGSYISLRTNGSVAEFKDVSVSTK